jgi:hypothetical protein
MLAANYLKKIHFVFSPAKVYEWNSRQPPKFWTFKKIYFLLPRSKFSILDIEKLSLYGQKSKLTLVLLKGAGFLKYN